MEQASRQGARRGLRRALGRALLVVGGTVGGTLLGWSLAAGTAHADQRAPQPAPSDGSVLSTLTAPLTTGTDGALAVDGGLLRDADPAGVLAVPRADRLIAAVPAVGPNDLVRVITPARSTIRGVAGALVTASPVRLGPAQGALVSNLGAPLLTGGEHLAGPEQPVREPALPSDAAFAAIARPAAAPAGTLPGPTAGRAVIGRPAAVPAVASSRFAHDWRRACPVDVPQRHAPLGPFSPPPVTPVPSAGTGPLAGGGAPSPGAIPQPGTRSQSQRSVVLPYPAGAVARLGALTNQPGVTPD